MKQVCILVDDSILSHHHGVRKYLFSLAELIGSYPGVNVDILLSNGSNFYKLKLSKYDLASNGYTKDALFAFGKDKILGKLRAGEAPPQSLPADFKRKECRHDKMTVYDICLLGAPWCHNKIMLPLAKKHYCMAYDAVPNYYALSKPYDSSLWSFALEHIDAYIAYTEKFDGVVAIGSAAAHQCATVLGSFSLPIITLPVFFPAGFEDLNKQPFTAGIRNQIILAAPFDVRKGIKKMPELINASGVKSVVIFGGLRCDRSEAIDFFSSLHCKDITWWGSVSLARQISLYRESLFLLFPSLNEGLGLPVLEAFACGLPAMVSDIDPLNKLAPEKFVIKNGVGANDLKRKFKILTRVAMNKNGREKISEKAHINWGHSAVSEQVINLIGVLL